MSTPGPALAAALARLEASRAHLQRSLHPPDEEADLHGESRRGRRRWRVLARWLMGRSSLAGLLKPARYALRGWWRGQSWRPAVELAADMAEEQLVPTVRRHPWLTVAAAMAAGVALVHVRPWRWSFVARQASLWRGALIGGVVAELARPEIQAAILGTLLAARGGVSRPAPPPEAAPEPAPAAD